MHVQVGLISQKVVKIFINWIPGFCLWLIPWTKWGKPPGKYPQCGSWTGLGLNISTCCPAMWPVVMVTTPKGVKSHHIWVIPSVGVWSRVGPVSLSVYIIHPLNVHMINFIFELLFVCICLTVTYRNSLLNRSLDPGYTYCTCVLCMLQCLPPLCTLYVHCMHTVCSIHVCAHIIVCRCTVDVVELA